MEKIIRLFLLILSENYWGQVEVINIVWQRTILVLGGCMKVYVNVKNAGSRKNFITEEEVFLENVPLTLRALIEGIVTKNVEEFNKNTEKERLVDYLTKEDIEAKAKIGKVSFGSIYNDSKENLDKALAAAFLAYEDGIYKVFIGDNEAGNLDEPIGLNEGDILTFIKFTMLAGRLW